MNMSKMTKIQSLKQQKKYRNETISILNHMKTKITTPTIADKSIHALKSIKPQVQSSRLNRPDFNNKLSDKFGVQYYVGYSREKDKQSDDKFVQVYQKMSSKSLQSKHGSYHTQRKQTEKTKKNSYSKIHTQYPDENENKNWSRLVDSYEKNFQKRLKLIENIFLQKGQKKVKQDQIKSQNLFKKSSLIFQLKKNLNLPDLLIQHNENGNGDSKQNRPQYKSSEDMILELKQKFVKYNSVIQDRKNKMIYDEIDIILSNVIKQLHKSFVRILNCLLNENEQKLLDIEMTLQQMLINHQNQIQKYSKRCEKIREVYVDQIQSLLIKSLYMTDKINSMQEKGVIHFQKQAKICDGEYFPSQNYDISSDRLDVQLKQKEKKYLNGALTQRYQKYNIKQLSASQQEEIEYEDSVYAERKEKKIGNIVKVKNKALKQNMIQSFR